MSVKMLLEKRLAKYNRLIREWDFEEDEDEFVFDPDWYENEENAEEEPQEKEEVKVIEQPKKKVVKEPVKFKDPEAGVDRVENGSKYTFNKKGNIIIPKDEDLDDLLNIDTSDISDSEEDEDDVFIPDWMEDDEKERQQNKSSKKEKKNNSAVQDKKPEKKKKINKYEIPLEVELMNDEDGVEYIKPTISVSKFQKAVDKYRVTSVEFNNPYYNELFSKTVPNVNIDKYGRIYISFSFRTPEDMSNEKYGSGVIIRKNSLGEVFNCLYALLKSVNPKYGSIFVNDYMDFAEYYFERVLEEDDDKMELMDELIRKLQTVEMTNVFEVKTFVDWYSDKKDEYDFKYFDKTPEIKKARHQRTRKQPQLFREYDLKRDHMKDSQDAKYIDIMGNIIGALDYDETKCRDYKPMKRLKIDDLIRLYVAGLIIMQKKLPMKPDDVKDSVFKNFALSAIRQGADWKDFVKVWNLY